MKVIITLIALLLTTAAWAETPYPVPKHGRETITRTGTCPTGYVGLGKKCEALHKDRPRAYPYIPGTACPSGTFRSGDACKEFR
ncbi:hypothetical protein [Bradyrhizobium elkanii]|uniref:hypothetical protein n=1 Tax=Bradyrhizobium elkanii TaxID=29448 RepID=UPI0035186269